MATRVGVFMLVGNIKSCTSHKNDIVCAIVSIADSRAEGTADQ